jgi:predicted secreted Zn-dependent protease
LLAGLAVAACVSTSSRITTTYYTINGITGADLDREIATKGPLKGHALALRRHQVRARCHFL